jgi:hypothetical protein
MDAMVAATLCQATTRDRELAADHASVERTTVFAESFDVELQSLLCVGRRLGEGVALSVQAGEIGGVYVVAALFLWGEHKLDLVWLLQGLRIGRSASRRKRRVVALIERGQPIVT